jgi:hypothetical protein
MAARRFNKPAGGGVDDGGDAAGLGIEGIPFAHSGSSVCSLRHLILDSS